MSTDSRLRQAYSKALADARSDLKQFLRIYEQVMSGKIKPPLYYVQTGQQEYWRNGYINALIRKMNVEQILMEKIGEAGSSASSIIKRHLQQEYGHGRLQQLKIITDGCKRFGLNPQFLRVDTQAIQVAVNDSLQRSAFSQIKFGNFGKNEKLRQRMQVQMASAIANGESKAQLVKRIASVYGSGYENAQLCAQTQGTRIRNEARYNADLEAEQMGIQMERRWHCRFQNTREGHALMQGKAAQNGGWNVPWVSGKKSGVDFMRFPGDPMAHAANVCNCHCSVQTRVKSDSPALRALRERNDERRERWLQNNSKKMPNNGYGNWRDRLFENGNHPYSRKDK